MNEAPKVTQRCHACTGELSTHTQDGETTIDASDIWLNGVGAVCVLTKHGRGGKRSSRRSTRTQAAICSEATCKPPARKEAR